MVCWLFNIESGLPISENSKINTKTIFSLPHNKRCVFVLGIWLKNFDTFCFFIVSHCQRRVKTFHAFNNCVFLVFKFSHPVGLNIFTDVSDIAHFLSLESNAINCRMKFRPSFKSVIIIYTKTD